MEPILESVVREGFSDKVVVKLRTWNKGARGQELRKEHSSKMDEQCVQQVHTPDLDI